MEKELTLTPVRAVRQAIGETQAQFAKRIGVGLRSLKRYEADGTLPENEAVRRNLGVLAKKHGVQLPESI